MGRLNCLPSCLGASQLPALLPPAQNREAELEDALEQSKALRESTLAELQEEREQVHRLQGRLQGIERLVQVRKEAWTIQGGVHLWRS